MNAMSDVEFTALLCGTLARYGDAMKALAEGVPVRESDIAPAIGLIRHQFNTLRAENLRLEDELDGEQLAVAKATVMLQAERDVLKFRADRLRTTINKAVTYLEGGAEILAKNELLAALIVEKTHEVKP